MLEVHDYSNRRGIMVPMLKKFHEMLRETAEKDSMAACPPPENYILWKQNMHKKLVDINRRWFLVLDGKTVAGLMFFYFERDRIYIEELRIAWAYRNNSIAFTLLIDKFINDNTVRKSSAVYAGINVKREPNQEILASVGFGESFENGWEPLGTPQDAAGALKLRYIK
jgi:hypothetical protein